MKKTDLQPFWQKHWFLLKVMAIVCIILFPVLMTYTLWRDEWHDIKKAFMECVYAILINPLK